MVWLPEGRHPNLEAKARVASRKKSPKAPSPGRWACSGKGNNQVPVLSKLKKPEAGRAQEASGELSCTGCVNKPAAVLKQQSTAYTEK